MAKPHRHPVLSDRKETVRQAIQRELEAGPCSAQDLSKLVSIREKEVAQHLEHLEKSLKHESKRLKMEAPVCLSCDFVFKERSRFIIARLLVLNAGIRESPVRFF